MRIHRTARTRYFTTLGNEVLRDNRLSFCARGVLGHLLSLPDGQRADIRTLAERTPEGRERVASALRELEKFGYLKRSITRSPDGQIYTEVDVFDSLDSSSPQVAPKAGVPGSGAADSGPDVDHPVKQRDEKPTHPVESVANAEGSGAERTSADTKKSVDVLRRVSRSEPKLSLGWAEAVQLAPLVTEWRRRGASDLHIISSLTAGLPRNGVYHPLRFSRRGSARSCLWDTPLLVLSLSATIALCRSPRLACAPAADASSHTARGSKTGSLRLGRRAVPR